MGKHKMEER